MKHHHLAHICSAAFLLAFAVLGCQGGSTRNKSLPKAQEPPTARKVRASAELPTFEKYTTVFPEKTPAGHAHWLDIDNDGRPDLMLDGCRLFLNQSQGASIRFRDVTEAAGIASGSGTGLCVDIDNDGWTDIVTTHGNIYLNRGNGTFADIGEASGFRPHAKSMTLAAGDLDGNGFPDIVIGMQEDWNNGHPAYYPMQCWLNNDGKSFTEAAKKLGITMSSYARGILIHDVDGDGLQDIYVANYRLQANALWMNSASGTFTNEAAERGVTGRNDQTMFFDKRTSQHYGYRYGHSIGACWLDFDNDGVLDLWVSNLVHKYVGYAGRGSMSFDYRGYLCDDSNVFHGSAGGVFLDWRPALRLPPMPIGDASVYRGDELWSGAAPADANNDGFQDVFVPQIYNLAYAKARLFLNCQGVGFGDAAELAKIQQLDTYCGAWADVNGDGLMDLVTGGRIGVNIPHAIALYVNTGNGTICRYSWLQLVLRAVPGSGTAVGAQVRVDDGTGLKQLQVNSAGLSTYGQQNSPALHFGFGKKVKQVTVDVTWPDGQRTTHSLATCRSHVLECPKRQKAPGDR